MVAATAQTSPNPNDVVTAFDASSRSWVTAGQGGPSHTKLPALDGALLVSAEALQGAAEDFGRVVSRRPSAVLRPGSVEDVARMVRFARQHRMKIGPRGQGHTMYGHCQVEAGIVIDMSALATIHSIAEDRALVDAGVSWSTLVAQTIAAGRTPPVLTDYLELSVGGTLSVGGLSGTSFRYGTQGDNVLELQMVTGEGELVTCSPTQHRELFEAALAGLGQCGIIVRATLRLVPAPALVRVYVLSYADNGTLIRDELRTIEPDRFDNAVAAVVPGPNGSWMRQLICAAYYTPPQAPDNARLLQGLSYQQGVEQIFDVPYIAFVNRLAPQIAESQTLGIFARPHPWVDLFVPGSKVEAFVDTLLQEVVPAEITPVFPILLYPFKRERLTRPLFRVPEEDTFFLVDVLRTAMPGARDGAEQVKHNRALFERNREWGGTHYAISAIPCTPEDWKRHYGSAWDGLAAAKRRYDPDRVLTPGPRVFE
ncbi:MAG TPA: FAD-binding protein [Myxococcaceae bacterium]|jgi:FAD/FMN-containing dehydrogenase